MKKLNFIVCWLFCTAFAYQLSAQEQMKPLPVDPQVRYGKLDNGLTYYIRHNEQPKDRADFYIAQRVGSMQEEDSQAGLAHFLEHMAFNGTKNFPGKSMINYLETIGVRFGENLNAGTGFDETVYNITNVPTTRQGIIDSCLLILHDWSNAISLDGEEIDKERGVIHEEWRTRGDAQMRLWEQQLPAMYPGSKYADRLPIGKMEVVDNFKHDELRNYYKKWYRPDLQAIIVVGDINVDKVEAQLKKIFADVPAPVNPAKREMYPVPDNDKPLVSVATDKEAPSTILYIFYKHDVMPQEMYATPMGLVRDYIRQVASQMINSRFNELTQKANPPFVYAMGTDGNFMVSKTKDAWTLAAVAKEGEIDEALTALVNEAQRIKKYGFTQSEYERARTNVLKRYESQYKERDKQKNNTYVNEYVSHFTDGGYIPGIETEYTMLTQIAPNLPVEEVNRYVQALLTDKNIVIALTGPEKEGLTYPTPEQLLADYYAAQKQEVEPYEETVSKEPLVSNLPEPGKIISIKENPVFGTTEIVLSNGIKVNLKKTDFKEDEILLTATSPGGSSLFNEDDLVNIKAFNSVMDLSGLGNFTSVDLGKKLAGKKVYVGTSLGNDQEKVSGSVSPKDMETLFQLLYLTFTAPYKDEEAFNSFKNRMEAQMKSMELNPMVSFSDTLNATIYDSNPRTTRLKADEINKIDYDRILKMYKERFGNASDFIFTFVGNIHTDSIKPYLEQYLGSLPTQNKTEKANEKEAPVYHKGKKTVHFKRSMETPKAAVINIYSGNMDRTLENLITSTMLKQILDIVYVEKVREDEGGTYGVSVGANISSFPEGQAMLQTYFDTDPAKREKLNNIVHTELKRIADEGPRQADFNKTKENMLKKHTEQLQENGYWLSVLDNYYTDNFDFLTQYNDILNAMTPEKIKAFADNLIKQGNMVEVVMEPETNTK
ncbi:M16 family metallopeptidase [Parabacteroides pacaensis]|uniref:M16 family metallopeptidase n=1 Tax=Parabacteroides pacaensis TaxID=2086575 RepID=UPI000D0F361D|nr:M16 family metallopeptidase [Parabacteroides pacaensis]